MKAGRAERFTALYAASYPPVLAFCLRRLDPDTARDVTAEVFLVAWRRLDEVPADPLPWLLRTAHLTAASQGRRARRGDRLAARVATVDAPGHGGDPADRVVEQALVRDALDQLLPADREVLVLVAWDGLDHAAVAQVLGCSRAAARVRLHRARRRLSYLLHKQEAAQWQPDRLPRAVPAAAQPGREEKS